jgi:hypothetical protein
MPRPEIILYLLCIANLIAYGVMLVKGDSDIKIFCLGVIIFCTILLVALILS